MWSADDVRKTKIRRAIEPVVLKVRDIKMIHTDWYSPLVWNLLQDENKLNFYLLKKHLIWENYLSLKKEIETKSIRK